MTRYALLLLALTGCAETDLFDWQTSSAETTEEGCTYAIGYATFDVVLDCDATGCTCTVDEADVRTTATNATCDDLAELAAGNSADEDELANVVAVTCGRTVPE